MDFKQFFQFYEVLNSKFLAKRIGMNPILLSHYVQEPHSGLDLQSRPLLYDGTTSIY